MKDNIILIAATNRPDILDPALLRPGRFDRQVVVDRPDRKGRKQILEVHTRGKPLAKEIDLDALAGQTPGFTGADLANLINEAALLTARSNKREITMHELEEGIMRVIAGPEKKSRVMSEKERLVTAYHELGHAIVGHTAGERRPSPQGFDHQPRPGSRLHDLAADRGQVPDHPRRAQRHDGDDPGRPRRRGDRLRGDHHRRLQRPREGDRDREADGDALRDVRAPRAARLRPRSRPALPGPRVLGRARLLRRGRARDRRRDPPHRRGGPPDGTEDPHQEPQAARQRSPRSCSSARRSRPSSSSPCSRASPRKRSSPTTRRRPPSRPRPRPRRAPPARAPVRACSRSPVWPAAAPPRCAATSGPASARRSAYSPRWPGSWGSSTSPPIRSRTVASSSTRSGRSRTG